MLKISPIITYKYHFVTSIHLHIVYYILENLSLYQVVKEVSISFRKPLQINIENFTAANSFCTK
jgi:hypothetical protein